MDQLRIAAYCAVLFAYVTCSIPAILNASRCDYSSWNELFFFLFFGGEAQQISKGANKAALFYVEQTVTVHIVLFYV